MFSRAPLHSNNPSHAYPFHDLDVLLNQAGYRHLTTYLMEASRPSIQFRPLHLNPSDVMNNNHWKTQATHHNNHHHDMQSEQVHHPSESVTLNTTKIFTVPISVFTVPISVFTVPISDFSRFQLTLYVRIWVLARNFYRAIIRNSYVEVSLRFPNQDILIPPTITARSYPNPTASTAATMIADKSDSQLIENSAVIDQLLSHGQTNHHDQLEILRHAQK